MIAYKFLQADRVAPFSGLAWRKDEAVEAIGPLVPCSNGVHACRAEHVSYWLDEELWEVELEGDVVEHRLKLVARRGQLIRRIDAWDAEMRTDFALMCLRRVAEHAAGELREAGLEAEAAVLSAAAEPGEVTDAARAAAAAAAGAGVANAERLASYAEDAVGWAETLPPSGVAYVAAHTADSRSRRDSADAFAAERAFQADWLVDRLGLSRDGG